MPEGNSAAQVDALKRIIEITALLNSTLNLDELLDRILVSAAELIGTETSSLLLVDEETGDLSIHIATGPTSEEATRKQVPSGKGIAGWVVEHGEPAVVESVRDDERFYSDMDAATGFETRSMLALPLKVRGETIGVAELINKRDGGFTDDDMELASALVDQAAIAIDNARLSARLANALVETRRSYRL
jgi:phosphoserine phosphatase RsbU/P